MGPVLCPSFSASTSNEKTTARPHDVNSSTHQTQHTTALPMLNARTFMLRLLLFAFLLGLKGALSIACALMLCLLLLAVVLELKVAFTSLVKEALATAHDRLSLLVCIAPFSSRMT